MKMTTIAAALLLAAGIAAAEGGAERPDLTGPFPTVDVPAGDLPIGYWDCWFQSTVWDERYLTSNNPSRPHQCAVPLFYKATVLELLPGGYGWINAVYPALGPGANQDFDADGYVFRIPGAGDEFYFSRAGEIRWYFEGNEIWILSQVRESFEYRELHQDILAFLYYESPSDSNPTVRLLFRVGSDAYRTNLDFVLCLKRNKAVENVFDTERCVDPLSAMGLPQLRLTRMDMNPYYRSGPRR